MKGPARHTRFDSVLQKLAQLETETRPPFSSLQGNPALMAQAPESPNAALVENLRDARERVTAKGKEVAQTLDSEVHRSPWLYIGVAALLSALFGFLLGRGSRR